MVGEETMAVRIEDIIAGVEMDGGSTTDIRSGTVYVVDC